MSNLQTVIAGIYDLNDLNDLKKVFDAASDRQKSLRKRDAAVAVSTLAVGDQVKLRDISPKYLNGATVEVTGINGSTIHVKKIDGVTDPKSAMRIGNYGRVPASCVSKIEEQS